MTPWRGASRAPLTPTPNPYPDPYPYPYPYPYPISLTLTLPLTRYEQALTLEPSSIDVLLKRSSLWFEKEQLPQAHADFDTAIRLDPSHPDIYCHRGQLHMLQNELSAAIADLRKAVKLDPASMLAAIQLGMALHRNQQPTEARTIFEQAEVLPLCRKRMGSGLRQLALRRLSSWRARARLRLPQAPASLGQSAAWAGLTCHPRAAFPLQRPA